MVIFSTITRAWLVAGHFTETHIAMGIP